MKSRFVKRLIIPMIAVIVLSYGTWLLGLISFDMAIVLQNLGVSCVIFCNLIWIVLVDSAQRWPNDSTLVRARRLFTFSTK